MKKFFLALALLPLVSFGFLDRESVSSVGNVRVYSWSDDFTVSNYYLSVSLNTYDDVVLFYLSNTLGVQVNPHGALSHPVSTDSYLSGNSLDIDYQLRLSTTNHPTLSMYSPMAFQEVRSFVSFGLNLWKQGYRGRGLSASTSSPSRINLFYPDLVSDLSVSTNNAYRSMLLSYLNQINNSLSSIGSSVGTINADYQTVNNLILNPSKQNLLDSAAVAYTVDASPSVASNLDRLYNHTPSRNAEITKALSDLASSQLQAAWLSTLDPDSPFYEQDITGIITDPDKFRQAALQGGGGGGSAIGSIMRDVKKLSTNDWVSAATNQLANNTANITNRLAHMFDDDSNPVTSHLNNIDNSAGAIEEHLQRGITVAVVNSGANSVLVSLDGPINIDQTQFNSLSVPLGSLQNTVSDWYSDWYSFFSVSSPVYKWENFYNMVSAFKDVNHTDLVSLQSCVSNLLLSLHGDITNLVVSTNGYNDYLLLSDYADYIHSGGLDTLLDVMDDDSYLDFKSEIDSLYHADTSEGYGRWWRYFTGLSTVQANSIFKLSNIFQAHEKLLTDLKRDNSDLDVQDVSDPSVFRKLLYTIPSEEDTFNKLAELTNSIDQSGMVRVQSLIPDLTNRLNVVASLFDKDFHLPTEISWELIPADPSINSRSRIVTIRPYDHYRLFQMLHYGLAFSYCLVNLILFPKFLLLLVRLFDRVWNKSEKLIYNSTQS